jgi:hypothetical protein
LRDRLAEGGVGGFTVRELEPADPEGVPR